MSDYLQILVDRDATVESAHASAASVLEWMRSNGIVAMTPATNQAVVAWVAERGLPALEESAGWPPGPSMASGSPIGTLRSAIWMGIAWLIQLTVIGLPVALLMFNRTPFVASLYRY